MPRVPTYDNFQIDPIGLPSARMTATPVQTTATDQAQEMGRQMMGAGGQLAKAALQMQEQIDLSRADEASNKLKEAVLRLTYDDSEGYTKLRGNNALERPDGKSLDEEYGEKLSKYRDEIAAGLGNDAQRAAFMRNASAMQSSFQGSLLKHMADESATYQASVQEGLIDTALREVTLAQGNPETIANATQRIEGSLWKVAKLKGYSAEWVENKRIAMLDKAHSGQISALLDGGAVDAAQAYVQRNFGNIDANSLLKFNGLITQQRSIALGQSIASGAAESTYKANYPSELDKLLEVKWQIESGNKQFNKDGSVVTSPKGAIGAAQVLPSTGPEAAKLAGLPWDATRFKTDEKYNKALGAAYFQEKLRQTGGNTLKAYAAYNAGLGGLQEGERKAAEWNKKNPSQPKDWLAFMPAETQGYVAKAKRLLESGSSTPKRVSKIELISTVRQDPRLASDPVAMKAAVEMAEKNYDLLENQRKTNADNAMAQALEYGAQTGWRISELPPGIKSQIPAEEWGKLQGLYEKGAKGDNKTDALAYGEYFNTEEGRAKLKRMTPQQVVILAREHFNEADGKALQNLHGQLNGIKAPAAATDAASKAGDLDRAAFKATAEPMLRHLGFTDEGGKKSNGAKQMATAMYAAEKQILRMQQDAGKKFSDAEMAAALDKIFAATTTLKGGFFGSDETVPIISIARDAYNINADLKAELVSGLKDKGFTKPTDEQIKTAYLMLRLGHVR